MTRRAGVVALVPILLALLSAAIGVVVWAQDKHQGLADRCHLEIRESAETAAELYAGRPEVSALAAQVHELTKAVDRLTAQLEASKGCVCRR